MEYDTSVEDLKFYEVHVKEMGPKDCNGGD
jgi:hypothetical protein